MSLASFRSGLSGSSCSCLSIPAAFHSIHFTSECSIPFHTAPFSSFLSILSFHSIPVCSTLSCPFNSIPFHFIHVIACHANHPLRGDACIARLPICLSSLFSSHSSLISPLSLTIILEGVWRGAPGIPGICAIRIGNGALNRLASHGYGMDMATEWLRNG